MWQLHFWEKGFFLMLHKQKFAINFVVCNSIFGRKFFLRVSLLIWSTKSSCYCRIILLCEFLEGLLPTFWIEVLFVWISEVFLPHFWFEIRILSTGLVSGMEDGMSNPLWYISPICAIKIVCFEAKFEGNLYLALLHRYT